MTPISFPDEPIPLYLQWEKEAERLKISWLRVMAWERAKEYVRLFLAEPWSRATLLGKFTAAPIVCAFGILLGATLVPVFVFIMAVGISEDAESLFWKPKEESE